MSEAAKETVHLQGLFMEILGNKMAISILISIMIIKVHKNWLTIQYFINEYFKHIKSKYHFIREQVQEGNIIIKYLCTWLRTYSPKELDVLNTKNAWKEWE